MAQGPVGCREGRGFIPYSRPEPLEECEQGITESALCFDKPHAPWLL